LMLAHDSSKMRIVNPSFMGIYCMCWTVTNCSSLEVANSISKAMRKQTFNTLAQIKVIWSIKPIWNICIIPYLLSVGNSNKERFMTHLSSQAYPYVRKNVGLCTNCTFKSHNFFQLKNHVKNENLYDNRYFCNSYNQQFVVKQYLVLHLRDDHNDNIKTEPFKDLNFPIKIDFV
jgi:hypothetical protein